MSFTTWQYLLFLTGCLVAVRLLGNRKASRVFLLLASCAFYAFWEIRLVPLFLAMAAVTYFIGKSIRQAPTPQLRTGGLWAGIVINLFVLGLFKYYSFFASSLVSIFRIHVETNLGLILPIGISFVTFEVLSYVVDVYRGDPEADSLLDFTLMVMFFPHLIAGPILKPRDFLTQLINSLHVSWNNIEEALPGFLMGFAKKALVADSLAQFVDPVFARPHFYSSLTVWLAVIAYALQIYCDFSGYSDMAIASAKGFGLTIPPNFNMPYIALNVSDFWRRWNISLTRFLTDYVYIPLGGNRKGLVRASGNTMIVMLISGLWHGAGWNFIVWGGMHGIAMVTHRLFRAVVPVRASGPTKTGVFAAWLATCIFLCFAWVFFRAASFSLALQVIAKMLHVGYTDGIAWIPPSLIVALAAVALATWIGLRYGQPQRLRVLSFGGGFTIVFVVLVVLAFSPTNASPFIYFQF